MPAIIDVATHPGTRIITLSLDDGTTRTVDIGPFLWGPVFEPLVADRSLYDQARVDPDTETVTWPNGADIAPDTLLSLAVADAHSA